MICNKKNVIDISCGPIIIQVNNENVKAARTKKVIWKCSSRSSSKTSDQTEREKS